jgi:hypothetical protein
MRLRISEALAWLCLAAIFIIGLPLFICMPLWVDTTYHDLSARNILWGGTHYRDIFETNLPGMVWLHALVRPIIGWSSEAIRAADFVVVGASIVLLCLWVKRIGLGRAGQAWLLAASFLFYLFESEFIHCQRDGWMLLPTVLGLHLRGRQLARASEAAPSRLYAFAVLEGTLWASAIWIKPHAVVPALCVWLVGARALAGLSARKAFCDFLGLLTGGLLIGGAGTAWLVATGTWPHMWDVLLNWNPEYYKWTPEELDGRLAMVIMYFAPWSLVHFVALPLAFVALLRARVWNWGPSPGLPPARRDQALLAGLYLGWFAEAVFLQKTFHYSQAPVHLIALALLAAQRWPVGPVFIGWCLIGGALNECRAAASPTSWLNRFEEIKPYTFQQLVPRHKLLNQAWSGFWWTCVTRGSSPEIKDDIGLYAGAHCAPNWTELDQVRKFLQTLDLQDRELVCWDDTTHPLYLDLNIRPGIRFMHVNTSLDFRSKRPVIRQELINSGHQYVVSDMAVLHYAYPFSDREDASLELPNDFPCFCRDVYPWNQPIVAKFGRYCVHRIEKPIGAIRIPYPRALNKK